MTPPTYPSGTVRALLATDFITPQTRDVLQGRLAPSEETGAQALDEAERATLRAAVARLLAQPAQPIPDEMAGEIDRRLANGESDGWRYASMPPDKDAYRLGLRGLDESAHALFASPFVALSSDRQDQILHLVQRGTAPGATWASLPAPRFFEELLVELCEAYYSHPIAQEEIGYVGMADNHGWHAIGLNQLDPHEPLPLNGTQQAAVNTGNGRYEALQPLGQSAPLPLLPMRQYAVDEEVDVIVVGTGAGGAPLLARLAAAGMRVVALEAGRFWQPQRDFATDERAQTKLFWHDERLSAGGDPVPFGANNSGIGVGGSTLHYTAYVPRAQPDDFRIHSDFGVAVDWPIGYDDLEPYYDEVEHFLGVSGPASYPWGPQRKSYPLPPLPLNGAAQLMERACHTLGIRTSPAANAALSAPYYQPGVGWRRACTNRGFCQAGCSVGAKASMDVTYLPLALANGAEIRPDSFVHEIERDDTGRVTGVVYLRNGVWERQRCRVLFLCAGGIETPRLLLLNNLANASGQVGRNFMVHNGIQVWGQFPDDIRPYKGIPGALISEDTHRPADADFVGGYLLQSIGVMPVTYASQLARGRGLWNTALRDHMRSYNHTAGINILGDSLPDPQNYLELSDEMDARGLPKPRVYYTQTDNDRRMNAHAEKLMRAIWTEAGAREMWAYNRTAHTLGTCRMGNDAQSSVVNRDGRAWDVPNLYIVDNSIFATALSVNPALTLVALSLRIADRFIEQARHGEG